MLLGGGKLTSRDTKRHSGRHGLRLVLKAVQQLLGLVETALKDTDLRKSRGRMSAPRTLARIRQLADRRKQFALRSVDPAVRREDIRATCPTEREERDRVVLAHEILQHRTPLLRTLGVTRKVAREHQRAANIRERLKTRRLSRRCRRHRLIKARESVVHAAHRHLGQAKLGECPQLKIGVACDRRDRERHLREPR